MGILLTEVEILIILATKNSQHFPVSRGRQPYSVNDIQGTGLGVAISRLRSS